MRGCSTIPADVRPAHLSRLRVPGGELEDIVRLHAEWALGLGRFADLRSQRLAAGIREADDVAALVGEGGSDWSVKFTVADGAGLVRTSVIKIAQRSSDVCVEHLVVRDGAASLLSTANAESPEVVRWLLANLPLVQPSRLCHPQALLVEERDVGPLVDDALRADRMVPMVLVAVENASRSPLVDPEELARRLAGMTSVHRLASVRESYRLREELASRGMNEKLGCYNGGVRILWPGIGPDDNPYDHLLMLPPRLHAIPATTRTEQVAGVFCELIAESEDLRRWIRDVDGPPRPPPAPIRAPAAVAPRSIIPRPPVEAPALEAAHTPVETEDVDPPTPEPPITREDATPIPALKPASKSTWAALADDLAAGFQLADEQERELDILRGELAAVRKDLRRAEQERDEIKGSLGPPRTVSAAVAHAEALFTDRLVVLRSARVSAEDSPYRDAPRVLFVLALLANCDAGGIGDVIHKALGGMARWKPKDSPETLKTFGRERTWTDSIGKPKVFGRHITLGHGVNPQKCLQVYYDVFADGRIEVAWCGEHRPTVGEDT